MSFSKPQPAGVAVPRWSCPNALELWSVALLPGFEQATILATKSFSDMTARMAAPLVEIAEDLSKGVFFYSEPGLYKLPGHYSLELLAECPLAHALCNCSKDPALPNALLAGLGCCCIGNSGPLVLAAVAVVPMQLVYAGLASMLLFGSWTVYQKLDEHNPIGRGMYAMGIAVLTTSAVLNFWLACGGVSLIANNGSLGVLLTRFVAHPDLFAHFLANVVICPMMLWMVGRLAGAQPLEMLPSIAGSLMASGLLAASVFHMHPLYSVLFMGVSLSAVQVIYWNISEMESITVERPGRRNRYRSQVAGSVLVAAMALHPIAMVLPSMHLMDMNVVLYLVAFVDAIGKYGFCIVALESHDAIECAERWYLEDYSSCGTPA